MPTSALCEPSVAPQELFKSAGTSRVGRVGRARGLPAAARARSCEKRPNTSPLLRARLVGRASILRCGRAPDARADQTASSACIRCRQRLSAGICIGGSAAVAVLISSLDFPFTFPGFCALNFRFRSGGHVERLPEEAVTTSWSSS